MRIFLVSDSKTGINFFPELEAFLGKKIADADIEAIFVPFPEDIPGAVSKIKEEADLVFVFVLYDELDFKIKALLNKLMEIEMQGKARILKAIEESEFENLGTVRLEMEKEKLVEKWGALILDILFKPGKFKPEEKEGGSFF